MNSIVELSRSDKRKLRIWIRRETDAGMRTRMSMILHLSKGKAVTEIAESLHVARSTVYRVAKRFGRWGWLGFADSREATGRRVSQATMSRCLKAIGARLGRPRPILRCPWPKAQQTRRLRKLHRLLKNLAADEVAVHADEVVIHLNPKIGPDWMLQGQQKEVVTPGKNVKRYVAGARHARTGRLTWVTASHKRSGLFIDLLRRLEQAYPRAPVIHVIVDNYSIHSSRQTQLVLAHLTRIRLHSLPPYSPKFNPIERVWLDLHAEVTRNHRCATIEKLMIEVEHYLRHRNRARSCQSLRAVA